MEVKVEVKTEPEDEIKPELPDVTWFIDSSPEGLLSKNFPCTSWVFRGTYKTQQVAIKRVQVEEVEETKDNVLISELDHENVVKFLYVEENCLFKFFILELCAASLQGFFDQDYTGPMPSDLKFLCQLSRGLDYIHSKGLVYRKIKPENILISSTTPIVMKWADFGLTKLAHISNSSGSSSSVDFCWMSPEILAKSNIDETCGYSKKSDIFSAGCIYFYYLTRAHPFGKKSEVTKNILKWNPVSAARLADDHFAKTVILGMIAKEPADRITLAEVINELEPIPQQPSPLVVMSPPAPRYITGDEITPISGLELGVNSGTIHARVVTRPNTEIWQRNAGFYMKFFTMILRDDTGQVHASAFGENFQKFYPLFQLGREYAIKRATLRLNKRGEKELSLRKDTIVRRL